MVQIVAREPEGGSVRFKGISRLITAAIGAQLISAAGIFAALIDDTTLGAHLPLMTSCRSDRFFSMITDSIRGRGTRFESIQKVWPIASRLLKWPTRFVELIGLVVGV